jgi:hypothetical protein
VASGGVSEEDAGRTSDAVIEGGLHGTGNPGMTRPAPEASVGPGWAGNHLRGCDSSRESAGRSGVETRCSGPLLGPD